MHVCPFCGSEKVKYFARIAGGALRYYIGQVHCLSCGARGPTVNSHKMDYREHLTVAEQCKLCDMAFAMFDCRQNQQQGDDALPLFGGGTK